MAQINLPTPAGDRRGNRDEKRSADSWLEQFARVGYTAKGAIYIILGMLTLRVATGRPGRTPDTSDALHNIQTWPYGPYLLTVVAAGLSGYVLWRLVQAVRDTEGKGSSWRGLTHRAGYVAIGLAYAGILLTSLQILLRVGNAQSEQEGMWEDWTARVLVLPFGPLWVGLLGLLIVGIALEEGYRAYYCTFNNDLDHGRMNRVVRTCLSLMGRFGLTARAIIYGVIGLLLVQAAIEFEPHEVEGLSGALEWLSSQPYGIFLLAFVACGLIAYGLFAILEGWYRRIDDTPG